MNAHFKHLIADKIIFLACIGTVLLLLVTLTISLVLFYYLPPFLPLFNQMPWGVARLGTKDQIFIPLCIGFLILLINAFLASTIYEKIPLISRILCMTSFLLSFFIFLFTIRAIQIVL